MREERLGRSMGIAFLEMGLRLLWKRAAVRAAGLSKRDEHIKVEEGNP